ncbi:MAG: O-antigen ligase family protein [Betaproteobacteria bacterium]|nr:O-antigen ligase family protein [Betaproteobacteria bacterium]
MDEGRIALRIPAQPRSAMTDHINRCLLASAAAYLFLQPTNAATFPRSVAYGVAALCAVIAWLAARRSAATRIPMAGPSILVPLFAWSAWSWASLAWSVDPRYSLGQLEREIGDSLLVMLVFYVAARDARSFRVLVTAAIASFAFFALLAIGMQASQGTWDASRYHLGVGPWSTWLVLVAPLLFALVAPKPAGFGGGTRLAATGLVLLALLIVTARMSENRIVWIALCACFATAALAAAWRWPRSFTRTPLRWILPAAALLVVLGLAFYDSLVERADTVYQGRESVAATLEHDPRIVLWEHVKGRIAARPWTGYGFGRRILAGPLSAELDNPLLAHAHNVFASQWLQTGLPGLAAFAAFVGALALRYLRFLRSRDDTLAFVGMLGLALVAGFLAKNQTDDFLFRSNAKEFWAMTALLLGYGMRCEHGLAGRRVPAQAADAADDARARVSRRSDPAP